MRMWDAGLARLGAGFSGGLGRGFCVGLEGEKGRLGQTVTKPGRNV